MLDRLSEQLLRVWKRAVGDVVLEGRLVLDVVGNDHDHKAPALGETVLQLVCIRRRCYGLSPAWDQLDQVAETFLEMVIWQLVNVCVRAEPADLFSGNIGKHAEPCGGASCPGSSSQCEQIRPLQPANQ